jgi:hypothetical protein
MQLGILFYGEKGGGGGLYRERADSLVEGTERGNSSERYTIPHGECNEWISWRAIPAHHMRPPHRNRMTL